MTRDELMIELKKEFPGMWLKPGEDFRSEYGSETIWTGEGSTFKEEFEGEEYEMELFEYWAESDEYEMGVHVRLSRWLEERGYYCECNDPGTYFIIPE